MGIEFIIKAHIIEFDKLPKYKKSRHSHGTPKEIKIFHVLKSTEKKVTNVFFFFFYEMGSISN